MFKKKDPNSLKNILSCLMEPQSMMTMVAIAIK